MWFVGHFFSPIVLISVCLNKWSNILDTSSSTLNLGVLWSEIMTDYGKVYIRTLLSGFSSQCLFLVQMELSILYLGLVK